MNASKVEYTVKAEYVETNKANIRQVMADLKALGSPGILYSAFLRDDGKSFVHFVVRADEEAQKTLGDLASFEKFRRELKESSPESPPNAESLTLVGTSSDFF